jgi:vacuolar-type H+-ATPase subunit I/STV1
MSSVEKGKKRLFSAESPERLVSVIQTRVKEMETTLHEVQDSLHELKLIQRGEKPIVRMFEGEEAIKAVYEDIIETRPADAYEFGNIDEVRKFVPSDIVMKQLQAGLRRAKRESLYITDKETSTQVRENSEVRYISMKDSPAYGDIVIYGKKVAVSSFRGKMVSVLIESQDIADTLRELFRIAWSAKK